jgi:hypothetical protein
MVSYKGKEFDLVPEEASWENSHKVILKLMNIFNSFDNP